MTMAYNDITYRDTPRARAPQRAGGCGAALLAGIIGLVLGVLLMAGYLLLFAPAPRQASPAASGSDPVTITLDDTYVSQVVATSLTRTQPSLGLSNVGAQINPGDQLLISGNANTLGAARPFTATADVFVNNSALAIRVTAVQLGGLPVPDTLTSALEGSINNQLRQTSASFLPPNSGYAIKRVSTTAHRMTIFVGKP
ncbi:MAG TPA: hypothetical protein VGP82_13715 [Ktedonobacterales bacterium]|jgi:hypothetical protein|nr:hypothetical protein [Ktedonobacterales bacterium]